MSIWIRSSDKKRLFECHDIAIEKREIESTPIGEVKKKCFYSGISIDEAQIKANIFVESNNFKLISSNLLLENAVKYNDFNIAIEYQEQTRNYVYDIVSDGVVLGTYSTEEKALKVLDMIEEHIENENWDKVFQMPQDEKVYCERK